MPAVLVGIGVLVFGAHLFRAVFQRTRIPDVLPFFLMGLLLGPLLGWIRSDDFGRLGGVFTSIVLVVILFEGGLGLKLRDVVESAGSGSKLTVISFAASCGLLLLVGGPLLGLSRIESVMLGAILGGTSSAVVIPIAAGLPLSEKTRAALFLESSLSDVLCIVVTLALASTAASTEMQLGRLVGQIFASFLMAGLTGTAGALAWSAILDRVHDLDHSISTTPAFMLVIYGIAESLGYSGAIAALAFGVTLGNIQYLPLKMFERFASFRPVTVSEVERAVYAEVVFIAKAFFFVYIGLQVKGSDPRIWLMASILVLLIYAARLPVVAASFGGDTSRDDVSVAAMLAPKGLAAAVLASIPARAGFAGGAVIEATVYAVVLVSIVLTSALVFLGRRGVVREVYGRAFRRFSPQD